MHIPSARVYNHMRSVDASLWYVPANEEKETAFLIKAPTPTIKALIAGCPFQLFFGKMNSYLCRGVRIEDMPDTPILILGAQIVDEEHKALIKSIKQRIFPIFLFNEMDICLASSVLEIMGEDAIALHEFIDNESELYTGKFDDNVSYALDCFEFSVDKTRKYPNAHNIPIIEITPKIGEWETTDSYFYNNESSKKINISDKIEGETFENTIWGALTSVFPKALYKGPRVKKGDKVREFTDVFAYYEHGSFLIEAKDLSVIQAGYNKNEYKRLAGIQKQVGKAIKQLIGAANAFICGDCLFSDTGDEIIVDRNLTPHCIVLITELMTCGDWDDITNHLLNAMKQTGAFFHIIDSRELITLLKRSSGNPKLIDYNLVKRCELFIKTKNVFIRGM